MKESLDKDMTLTENRGKSKLRCFIDKQSEKLKNNEFRCPVCRETFKGISALGSHLKDHCT